MLTIKSPNDELTGVRVNQRDFCDAKGVTVGAFG